MNLECDDGQMETRGLGKVRYEGGEDVGEEDGEEREEEKGEGDRRRREGERGW